MKDWDWVTQKSYTLLKFETHLYRFNALSWLWIQAKYMYLRKGLKNFVWTDTTCLGYCFFFKVAKSCFITIDQDMQIDGSINGQSWCFAGIISGILKSSCSYKKVTDCRTIALLLGDKTSAANVIINHLQRSKDRLPIHRKMYHLRFVCIYIIS